MVEKFRKGMKEVGKQSKKMKNGAAKMKDGVSSAASVSGNAGKKILEMSKKGMKGVKGIKVSATERRTACETYIVMAVMHKEVSKSDEVSMFLNSNKTSWDVTGDADEEEQTEFETDSKLPPGIDLHSSDEDCVEFLKASSNLAQVAADSAAPPTTLFVLEDNHRAFRADESIASMCNHLDGRDDVLDITLSPASALGRAIARVMLFSASLTWCGTTQNGDSFETGVWLSNIVNKGRMLTPRQMATVKQAVAGQGGRDMLRALLAKSTQEQADKVSTDILPFTAIIFECTLKEALEQGDFPTIIELLRYMDRVAASYEDGAKSPLHAMLLQSCTLQWRSARLWDGLLQESMLVAQAAVNLTEGFSRRRYQDMDEGERTRMASAERRVAYGQLSWVVQGMTSFNQSFDDCRTFVRLCKDRMELFQGDGGDSADKVLQHIDILESEATRAAANSRVGDSRAPSTMPKPVDVDIYDPDGAMDDDGDDNEDDDAALTPSRAELAAALPDTLDEEEEDDDYDDDDEDEEDENRTSSPVESATVRRHCECPVLPSL